MTSDTSTDEPDLYAILGVPPTADAATITAAYRALARAFHPDISGDDTMMKQLNTAYETLRDSGRRTKYDHDRGLIDIGPRQDPNHAGPPPGPAYGPVITHGRFAGWSLGEIALVEERYLEWLMRTPGGRYLKPDIEKILGELQQAAAQKRRPPWTMRSREPQV
jgi:curved DNA-binding protein CbpA